ncbi:MAG: hypothetical protein AAF721_03065 [Myxococcota bacterium]
MNGPDPGGVPGELDPSQIGALADPTEVGIEHTNCGMGTINVPLPDVSLYPLYHGRGDADLGPTAELSVVARVQNTATRLWLTVQSEASDRSTEAQVIHDPSGFTRSTLVIVPVDVPDGCEIASVSSTIGRLTDRRSGNAPFKAVSGSGLIIKGSCRAGVSGSDRAMVGCRSLIFNQVEVRLRDRSPSCDDVELRLPRLDLPFGTLTRGASDVHGGTGVTTSLDVRRVRNRGGTVDIKVEGKVIEANGDHTTIEGSSMQRIFDVALDAPGCQIAGESGFRRPRASSTHTRGPRPSAGTRVHRGPGSSRRPGRNSRRPRVDPRHVFPISGSITQTVAGAPSESGAAFEADSSGASSLVIGANCVVNTPGSDIGAVGCTGIRTRPIKIELDPS